MNNRPPTPDILGNMLTGKREAELIPIANIKTDGGTQMRAALNNDTVNEYADLIYTQPGLSSGWPFDKPVVLYYDGELYWLADGFHRIAAMRQIHKNNNTILIPAEVHAGVRRDAILHAAGANAEHGLRRTNEDKRRTVGMLLRDEEWAQWSNVEIARRCKVDETMVRKMRAELEATSVKPKSDTRIGADGRTYNTTNIGANRPTPTGGTMPKYTVEQLRGIVRACAVENGMTPAGEQTPFWSTLQAWMTQHGGNTLWSVSDLRMALDQVVRQDKPAAASGDFAPVWKLESIVNSVWAALNSTHDAERDKQIARAARGDAAAKAGTFWNQCKAAMGDDIRGYRHTDLQQAINNVANQKAPSARAATQPGTPPGTRLYTPEPFVPTPNKPEPGVWIPPTLAEHNARPRVTNPLDLRPTVDMCWDLQYGKNADPVTQKANIERARFEAEHHGHFFNFCHDSADDALRPFTDHTLSFAILLYTDRLDAKLLSTNPELYPPAPDAVDYDDEVEPDENELIAPEVEALEAGTLSGLLERQQQCEDLRDRLIETLDALKQVGDLTGKYTHTLAADRELRKVIQLIDDELEAILKGEPTHAN